MEKNALWRELFIGAFRVCSSPFSDIQRLEKYTDFFQTPIMLSAKSAWWDLGWLGLKPPTELSPRVPGRCKACSAGRSPVCFGTYFHRRRYGSGISNCGVNFLVWLSAFIWQRPDPSQRNPLLGSPAVQCLGVVLEPWPAVHSSPKDSVSSFYPLIKLS